MYNAKSAEWEAPPSEYLSVQVFMRSNDLEVTTEVTEEELRLESCKENSYYQTTVESEKRFI